MSREVRRVPLDFDWPVKKVWSGYLMPDRLDGIKCQDCDGSGSSPLARHLHDLWYGYLPFHPAITGSTVLTPSTPAVRAFAERNSADDVAYYGNTEEAIVREGQRLANLWNAMWCHHLDQADVDALIEGGRLYDFTHTLVRGEGWKRRDPQPRVTAEQVNAWSLSGMGHDGINAFVVINARCARAGQLNLCAICEGHGYTEAYPGQRADADAWEREDPPTGDGYQLWETVSEGSPISPVFADAEALAQWMVTDYRPVRGQHTIESARAFVKAGWAPSFIGSEATGLVAGELASGGAA